MDAASFLYWSGLALPFVIAITGRLRILGKTSLKMYFYTLILFCILEGTNSLVSLFSFNRVYEKPFGFFSYAAYDGAMVLVIHKMLSWVDACYLETIRTYILPLLLVGFFTAIATEYCGGRLGIFLYEEMCLNPYLFDSVSLFPVINVTIIVPCIFVFIAKIRNRLA